MTCRATDDGRVVDGMHGRECNTSGCPGCLPCVPEHGHCVTCQHRHLTKDERWNCARCVGKVRENLRKIEAYTAQAHREVVQRGINSAAFMVAAPAADPEAHGFLHQSATSGRLCKCRKRGQTCPATVEPPRICPDAAAFIEDARDELHPLTVLGWWEMLWREELCLPSDERITVGKARRFLDEHLTRMAQQLDPDFDQFRTEVAACRTWLENVLGEGARDERGVQCFMCGRARLVKWYDDDLVTLEDGTVTGAQDHLYCPREDCGHWWSEADYRAKVDGLYVQWAGCLTAAQIAETYRVPESTVRRWASGWTERGIWQEPTVQRRGKSATGAALYDVGDVLAMRDRATLVR